MKKAVCKLVVLALVTVLSGVGCSMLPRIKGDGNLITSEKTVSAFEKIRAGSNAEVNFHASREYRVSVTVDANLEQYVEIFTEDDVLCIETEDGRNCVFTKFSVDVYCPVLTGISLSGAGRFPGIETITAPAFDVRISGAGTMEGPIECERFSADISGAGNMSVTGTSNDAGISISGSGKFNGSGFNVQNAAVMVSGAGKADIGVENSLEAKISGAGEINYRGEPKTVDSNVSGAGKVRKID
jgi:hypothetical protein